jgi:uncharacterized membrane protein YcaP (DUF421 family)
VTAVADFCQAVLGLGVDGRDLTLAHVLARSTVVFLYLLVLLRVAKRRFLAQRDPLDVLLSLLLAAMISRAINGSAAFVPTLGGALLLVLLHRALTRVAFLSPAIARWLKGTPVELIRDGVPIEHALDRHAMTGEDLEEDLRLAAGVGDPSRVECARFERNGRVSVERVASAPEARRATG